MTADRKDVEPYKFKLKDLCSRLNLNYNTAQAKWIANLKNKGFDIQRADNSGNYIMLNYTYSSNISTMCGELKSKTGGDMKLLRRNYNGALAALYRKNKCDITADSLDKLIDTTVKNKTIPDKLVIFTKRIPSSAYRLATLISIADAITNDNYDVESTTERWCEIIDSACGN
jgi:hypothetical protein